MHGVLHNPEYVPAHAEFHQAHRNPDQEDPAAQEEQCLNVALRNCNVEYVADQENNGNDEERMERGNNRVAEQVDERFGDVLRSLPATGDADTIVTAMMNHPRYDDLKEFKRELEEKYGVKKVVKD